MREKEVVSLVKCSSYEQARADKAIEKALNMLDFDFSKYREKKVLIKPNLVGIHDKNQIAVTTNKSLIEAVCKILKKHKCKIYIGDSPFTNPKQVMEKTEIGKVARKYGKLVIFDQEKMIKIRDEKAHVLKNFYLPRIVKEASLIINMPKLKTHQLTKFTGAIKNLYGCIPGGMKQKLHAIASKEKKFSKMLVDIYQNIKPELNIMDAVIGMEGNGPSSGDARKVGLILASRNAVALDIAACRIIGQKIRKVYAIKQALKRKLASKKIIVYGTLPRLDFKKPRMTSRLRRLFASFIREKPIVCDKKKCVKCGICARHCPRKAIKLANNLRNLLVILGFLKFKQGSVP